MKKIHVWLTVLLISFFSVGNAQRNENKRTAPVPVSPFDKGTLSFTNRPNLTYTNFSSLVNGDPKNYEFRIDPSYFITDGFAIGLDARIGGNSSKNAKSSFSSWQTNFTATYGRKITDKINGYVKVFAGPGGSTSEFDISTLGNSPQKLTATYFDIKGLIGAPIALGGGDAAFFTPYISYDYYKTKTSSNNFTDKTFAFGVKLESYIGKGQMIKDRSSIYKTAYLKGSHFLEFTSLAGISFDTRQQVQIGSSTMIAKQKITTTNIGLGYNYYFKDNFAAGLNISLNSTSMGYVSSTTSTTSTFMIQPVITAQAPFDGAGRNLFLQAGFGFGVYKAPKKTLTDLTVKAGYNLFLTKFLTLTPKIGYERLHGGVASGVSGIPYTNSGITTEIGVRSWLNFWKWK